jgi:hypothetical protein
MILILYSNKQIKFNLSGYYNITNVHTLNLYFCNNITDVCALCNVHTLGLVMLTVNTLQNVHILYLSFCNNITD